jgi:DNA-binding transcriptional regulator GbsR (MarR family)
MSMLRDALLEKPDTAEDRHAAKRMRDMLELIELTTGWMDDVQKLSTNTMIQIMKLGGNITKLLPARDRKRKAN